MFHHPHLHNFKRRTYQIVEPGEVYDKASRTFDYFILTLIFLNVLALILSSISSFYEQYEVELYRFEYFSVVVFTIEYILRLYAITENEKYSSPIVGRLRAMINPMILLDLFTFLPFYLTFLGVDLRFLRAIRLMRLFRLLKLSRYYKTLRVFKSVLWKQKEELVIAMVFLLLILLFASSLLYIVEHDAQPEKFSSIPHAMWWAVATLTTVGYGDTYPITAIGKILASVIAVLGIGMVALPAGILSSGFSSEIKIGKEIECPHCKQKFNYKVKNY